MNPAVASVVVAVVGVVGVVAGAIIQAIVGRSGRRAEMTDKITAASDRIMERMDRNYLQLEAKCTKCQAELVVLRERLAATEKEAHQARAETRKSNAVLRKLVRALDMNDQAAHDAAVAAARELV